MEKEKNSQNNNKKNTEHCHEEKQKCECSAQKTDFLKAIKEELEKLKIENENLKDTALRYRAEMENLRKRFEKEKEDALKFACGKFAKDLLPVIDSLEMAINHSEKDSNVDSVIDGVKITYKELLSAFQRNGISKIEAKNGDEFNHDLHQIMCELEEKSVESGKIAAVYQTGYTLNGRLLRASLVGIAK